jgi:phage terminase small subunit
MSTPKAPAHLKAAGRRFFDEASATWEQETHELLLLVAACEQIDIREACRKEVAASGLTITTDKGAVKENPALATGRAATRLLQALVRQMALADEPESYKGRVRPHRHRRPNV